MINFRYHIVSITAVFLALAIGTALGSTFLDGPTVDLLNRNIRSAEDRIEATNAENSRLSELNDQAREREARLLEDASGRLVSGLLTDAPVLVIVAPGVDADVAAGVTQIVGASGADHRGTVAMLEPMLFAGDLDEELAAALELDVDDQAHLGDEVYRLLGEAMAAAGEPVPVAPVGPDAIDPDATDPDATEENTTDTEGDEQDDQTSDPGDDATDDVPPGDDLGQPSDDGEDAEGLDGEEPAVVTALVEHGYLAVDRPSGSPEAILEVEGYRYVLVSDEGPDRAEHQAALRLVTADGSSPPLVVVAPTPDPENDDEDDPSGGLVGLIRDDDDLEGRINTIDGIDTFSGLIAMMLVLEDVDVSAPGHFGQAEGATSVVPSPR